MPASQAGSGSGLGGGGGRTIKPGPDGQLPGLARSASSSAVLDGSATLPGQPSRGAAGGAVCTGRLGPESAFLGFSHKVPAVSKCERPKRDATTGYRGFIPGIKSETVWGANQTKAFKMAHEFRPHSYTQSLQPDEWNCPPDVIQCVRPEDSVVRWTASQALPQEAYVKPGPRHADAAMGFSGHQSMRNRKTSSLTIAPHQPIIHLAAGERHCLPVKMHLERDYQPWDEHRVAVPGYSGHVRGRSTGAPFGMSHNGSETYGKETHF